MNVNEMNESEFILNFLVKLAPSLQKLMPLDCMIGIADTEKFLTIAPGEKMRVPKEVIGSRVSPSDPVAMSVKSGKPEHTIVPKDVLGITFESTAVPVTNSQGSIIGAIGLGIGIENREILIQTADQVATSSEQTSKTIEDLADSATKLAAKQNDLLDLAQEITNQINATEKIIEIIRGIATTSNMLGLNAAIESARAGEHGRGFSVVSSEIRKMAENSSSAIKDIESILYKIKDKIEIIDKKIEETASIGQHQAASTEELSGAMDELANSAGNLKKASRVVIG